MHTSIYREKANCLQCTKGKLICVCLPQVHFNIVHMSEWKTYVYVILMSSGLSPFGLGNYMFIIKIGNIQTGTLSPMAFKIELKGYGQVKG